MHTLQHTAGHAAGTGYWQVWDVTKKSEIQSIK